MDPPPIKEEALRMERKRNKALRQQHVTFLIFLLFLDPSRKKKYSIKMLQCVATER
jgi:hypothetical protein